MDKISTIITLTKEINNLLARLSKVILFHVILILNKIHTL